VIQAALERSEHVCKSFAQVSQVEAAPASCHQYSRQLQVCSSVVLGQMEGCTALHSQAISILRLAWDLEALLMYGHCMLLKNISCVNGASLKRMFASTADMIDGDCELHSSVVADFTSSATWAPLLRKCSGYTTLLRNMRRGHHHVTQPAKAGSAPSAKGRSPLLLYCIESREWRERPAARAVIDITDIKFPSPRRL
jgi:hypothetical protein